MRLAVGMNTLDLGLLGPLAALCELRLDTIANGDGQTADVTAIRLGVDALLVLVRTECCGLRQKDWSVRC